MLRFLSAVTVLLFLSLPAGAQWHPLSDGAVNAPYYGTARDMAVVYWNDDPYVFIADYNAGVCHSTDEGGTWIWSSDLTESRKATIVVPNPYSGFEGHVYIARDEANYDGFWRSTNQGITFSEKNNGLPSTALAAITSIYIDPNDGHDIYITCKAVSQDDRKRIFKSENEGDNWAEVFTNFPKNHNSYELDITSIYVLPGDPSSVWIGSSYSDPLLELTTIGVWATYNGGTNWSQELSAYWNNIYAISGIRKIVQNPNYPNETGPYCFVNFFKYVNIGRQDHCLAVYHKDDSDPGSFEAEAIIGGYYDDSDWSYFKSMNVVSGPSSQIYSVYALAHKWYYSDVDYIGPGVFIQEVGTGVDDMVEFNNGLFVPYPVSVAIDPEDYTTMYAASEDEPDVGTFYTTYGGVYKTTDWGDNWNEVTEDMHTCASLELISMPDVIWAGGTQPNQEDQANMLTIKDGSLGWSNRFVQGFNSVKDVTAALEGRVIAVAAGTNEGSNDSIYASTDYGETFSASYGDANDPATFSAFTVIPGLTSDYIYATSSHSPRVVKAQCISGNPLSWSSYDGNWPAGDGGLPTVIEASPSGAYIYAGSASEGLYYAQPSGGTWVQFGLDEGTYALDNISAIEVIARSTYPDTILVAGTVAGGFGKVVRTIDGGYNWQWSFAGMYHFPIVKSFAWHPHKRSVILATTIYDDVPWVYISLNGGTSWGDSFGDGLYPDVDEVKDIVFESSNVMQSHTVYVGTDLGIYKRTLLIPDENISSDTTWTNDLEIYLLGDISIANGATLTIEPGTQIYLAPNYDDSFSGSDNGRCEFIVNGTLIADGMAGESPISFKPCASDSISDTTQWYGIVCNSTGSVTLKNCLIEKSIYGVKASSGELDIRHCLFENIGHTAVYSTSSENYAVVDSNEFSNCYTRAIYFSNGVGHDFIGNEITDCKNGIQYSSSAGTATAIDIKDNTISISSMGSPQEGIHIESLGSIPANITGNTVSGYDKGLYVSNINSSGVVTDNYSHSNSTYGIYMINVAASFVCQSSTYNNFSNNYTGVSCNGTTSSGFAYNKAESNSNYGVYVANTSTPDFGIVGTGTGHNALYNPSAKRDMYRDGVMSPVVRAESCYWGGGAGNIYGNVDGVPYLTSDPLPRIDPGAGFQRPNEFVLMKSYPNPFNPSTCIEFYLSQNGIVKIDVFNVMGQMVKTLANDYFGTGNFTIIWDGTNSFGEPQASGIYFVNLTSQKQRGAVKVTLLR